MVPAAIKRAAAVRTILLIRISPVFGMWEWAGRRLCEVVVYARLASAAAITMPKATVITSDGSIRSARLQTWR
jgi:hypothetical protein